ncbi:MAG TPA: hypothetical protein VNA25_24475 [Phycisphaerae bacterium]|nr:hypothetical protein [Phycisphaerae bacterium]
MMGPTVESNVHFKVRHRGQKSLQSGLAPAVPATKPGRVPRLSRLMALAIRFQKLVRDGAVRDYADLARLGNVSRARLTQIMNLLNLAPDIQEDILFLPRTDQGFDPIPERRIRAITAVPDWRKQRRMWKELVTRSGADH